MLEWIQVLDQKGIIYLNNLGTPAQDIFGVMRPRLHYGFLYTFILAILYLSFIPKARR